MPVLPLRIDGSFARIYGIMHFPNADPREARKADTLAAKALEGGIEFAGDQASIIPVEFFRDIVRLGGGTLFDKVKVERRREDGVIIGELVKLYFGLARQRPEMASWQNAIRCLEKARNTSSGSSFKAAKARMLPAAHLWGAWFLRGMRLKPQPDFNYGNHDDFETFIEEAEALLDWGLVWRQARSKAAPPFPREKMWHAPDGWSRSIPRRVGWPTIWDTLEYDLPADLVGDLRPSGRPPQA